MCEMYRRNLKALTSKMYELGKFSEAELLQELRDIDENAVVIDGSKTIHAYLQELTEVGTLRYSNGFYSTGEGSGA